MANNRIVINIDVDANNSQEAINRIREELEQLGGQASDSTNQSDGLASSLKKLGMIILGVFAVDRVLAFGKSIVEAAASAQALNAQFEQVFGNMQGEATALMNTLGERFGMLPTRLQAPLTQTTSMFKGLGLSTEDAMKQAESAVTMVADAAAFYDMSFENANSALNSFIKGNYEGGEVIGLFGNETQLASWALKNLDLDFKKATEAQKQMARLEFAKAMQEAAGATGQAARESKGYENQLGNLKQAWTDLKALLGGPILEPVISAMMLITDLMRNFDTSGITNAVEGIKTGVVNAYNAVVSFWENFKKENFALLAGVSQAFETLKNTIIGYWTLMFGGLEATASEKFAGIGAKVSAALTFIFETIKTVLDAITPFISDTLSKVYRFWQENGEQIMEAVGNVWGFIKGTIEVVMPAIKFIIEYAWNAIKLVITGALDVIMGAIKIFSGLFTGDWSKMWEGIKQLFKGAIDLILGWMSLTFLGGIRTAFVNLSKAAINLVKTKWTTIVNIFKSFGTGAVNTVKSMATGVINFFKNILSSAKSNFDTMRAFGASRFEALKQAVSTAVSGAWNTVKSAFTNILNTVKSSVTGAYNAVKTGFSNMISAVRNAMSSISTTIANIWTSIWNTIKGWGTKMKTAGVDLVKGLIGGITEMKDKAVEAITGVVGGIVDKAKSLLKINSPSKLFIQFGKWVAQGLGIGIDKDKKVATNAADKLVDASIPDFNNARKITEANTRHAQSVVATVTKEIAAEVQKIQKENSQKLADIETAAAKRIQAIRDKAHKDKKKLTAAQAQEIRNIEDTAARSRQEQIARNNEAVAKLEGSAQARYLAQMTEFVEAKKQAGEMSIGDEVAYWQYALTAFEKGSSDHTKALKKYNDAVKAMYDERLKSVEQYISDKKSLDQLTLIQEAKIWEQSMKLFKKGSDQHIKAQQNYNKALKAVNDQIISINEKFGSEIQKVSDDMIKAQQDAWAKYEAELDRQTSSILSSAGNLFDGVSFNAEQSADELIENMQSQVSALDEWGAQFEALEKRGLSHGLLDELRAMGVKALPQLKALNGMTDEQLTGYAQMFEYKYNMARTLATKQLEGMRIDTQAQVERLRVEANAKLSQIQNDWTNAITNLTKNTEQQFESLEDIGRQAGQNLYDGLASMEDSLLEKASFIAKSIASVISQALSVDITGGNIDFSGGGGSGARAAASGVMNNASSSAGSIINSAKDKISTGLKIKAASARSLNANINNYFTPKESTPYEAAKKQKQQLQVLGTQM